MRVVLGELEACLYLISMLKFLNPVYQHLVLNFEFQSRKKRKRKLASSRGGGGGRPALPRFPKRPDMVLQPDQVDARKEQLQKYLNNLLGVPMYKDHHETVSAIQT